SSVVPTSVLSSTFFNVRAKLGHLLTSSAQAVNSTWLSLLLCTVIGNGLVPRQGSPARRGPISRHSPAKSDITTRPWRAVLASPSMRAFHLPSFTSESSEYDLYDAASAPAPSAAQNVPTEQTSQNLVATMSASNLAADARSRFHFRFCHEEGARRPLLVRRWTKPRYLVQKVVLGAVPPPTA